MEQLWQLRQEFSDPWISGFFTKENESLTKALQRSLDGEGELGVFSDQKVESLFATPEMAPVPLPTVSGGSESEAPMWKQRQSVAPSGRVAKRKARASKRATTTFITADPSNFRQMVQQVTGVRFGGLSARAPLSPVMNSEAHRPVNYVQSGGGFPMLDESAFFLAGSVPAPMAQSPAFFGDGVSAASGLEFESFCSFPTLESSKVV